MLLPLFLVMKYTRSELSALIKADLIRHWENPVLLPLLRIVWPGHLFPAP